MNFSTNVLQPDAGDMVALKVPSFLSQAQREMITEKIQPLFVEMGCKFIVLDGGSDMLLVKKPAYKPEPPAEAE